MTGIGKRDATTGGAAMFGGIPRRGWMGAVALAVWMGVALAFAGDLAPTASPVDWLYGVEARRDAHARAMRQRAESRVALPAAALVASASRGDGGRN